MADPILFTTRDSAGNVSEYAFCGVDCKTARFPRLG
jgi:hypothetical protein